jgi:tight adherence protein B
MNGAPAALVATAVATLTLGMILTVAGLRRTHPDTTDHPPGRLTQARDQLGSRLRGRTARVLLIGLLIGLGLYVLTGWVIAVPAATAAAFMAASLRTGRTSTQIIEQLDALQEWTLMLSGLMIGNQSLQQAIVESARTAPAPIHAPVTTLSQRLTRSVDPGRALRMFADELDDATADLIASTLLLGFREPRGLADVMRRLAGSVADDVKNRRAVEAARAAPRSAAKVVTLILSSLVVFVLVTNRSYIAAYSTPTGQLILAALLSLYAGLLWWMHRVTRPPVQPRIIGTLLPGAPGLPAQQTATVR